jgi:TolA-binding protein
MNLSLSSMSSWNALSGAVTVAIVLQGCTSPSTTTVEQKPVPVVDRSAEVRELRKQIRERDQRIEKLESQLEALKLIDQDSEKQKPPFKPPTTLRPLE